MIWTRAATGRQDDPADVRPSEIIGVVPDMPVTVRAAVDPTFYFVVPNGLNVLSIKLTGKDMPGTLEAIEAAWKRTGNVQPIQEIFLSQFRLNQLPRPHHPGRDHRHLRRPRRADRRASACSPCRPTRPSGGPRRSASAR